MSARSSVSPSNRRPPPQPPPDSHCALESSSAVEDLFCGSLTARRLRSGVACSPQRPGSARPARRRRIVWSTPLPSRLSPRKSCRVKALWDTRRRSARRLPAGAFAAAPGRLPHYARRSGLLLDDLQGLVQGPDADGRSLVAGVGAIGVAFLKRSARGDRGTARSGPRPALALPAAMELAQRALGDPDRPAPTSRYFAIRAGMRPWANPFSGTPGSASRAPISTTRPSKPSA